MEGGESFHHGDSLFDRDCVVVVLVRNLFVDHNHGHDHRKSVVRKDDEDDLGNGLESVSVIEIDDERRTIDDLVRMNKDDDHSFLMIIF